MTDIDVMNRDGKSITIQTGAVSDRSKIATNFKNNPDVFYWIEKIPAKNNDPAGSVVKISKVVTSPISFDWLIVNEN